MESKETVNFEPIDKQFTKYVVPSVIAMSVQAFYTVLNGIIAGQGNGEIALGAINIVLPFYMVIIALAMLVGIGGANIYSFHKGKGEMEATNNIFCQCLALSAIIGVTLALVGFFSRENLVLFLGANEEMFPAAVAYLKWLAPCSLLQMVVFVLIVFVRNDDAPKLVMVASAFGAVVNIILDIILIFVMHFGIEVIALTNGISMLTTGAFFIPHFADQKGLLRICKPIFHFNDIKRVLSNGVASFLMEFWQSAIALSFNLALVHTVGTLGVSAYSIVTYVCALINMILIGVTQGAQPLMSFYHGKGDAKAFSHVYRLGVRTNTMIPILLVAGCAAFGSKIVLLFHSGNLELTVLTVQMFRLFPLGFIFVGPVLMNILFFQATERNTYATLISFLRCIGFVQVFLLLFIHLFGANGIYLSFLAGEMCHFILSQILVQKTMKKLEKKVGEMKADIPEAP
ncbi:MATE family efflux transporter [Pectinatus frisingensis]|uniref:MATE family efflux transporter n=1 Tax=Pectinatus frisingensis TaxID=865 RepID=UPI0018C5558F|nr:MATE family efflux transporter [Pectinatus frisingensis]